MITFSSWLLFLNDKNFRKRRLKRWLLNTKYYAMRWIFQDSLFHSEYWYEESFTKLLSVLFSQKIFSLKAFLPHLRDNKVCLYISIIIYWILYIRLITTRIYLVSRETLCAPLNNITVSIYKYCNITWPPLQLKKTYKTIKKYFTSAWINLKL